MKNNIANYLLFITVFFSSCTVNTPSKNIATPQEQEENTTDQVINKDHDYYFIDTKTTKTKYGPLDITRNILQDSKGKYWLATWEGIITYDGQEFTNVTNVEKLRRYRAFTLLEDSKGNIWIGTQGAGIYIYDGQTYTNITTKDGLIGDKIACFYEDKAGQIWIGTSDGISVYNGTTFTNYNTDNGLADNDINSIIEDKTGKVWIAARGSTCIYDGQNFSLIKNAEDKTFNNVRCLIKDRYNNIWLAGQDGLWKYDNKDYTLVSELFTGYVYEDSLGNLWTSSEAETQSWKLSKYKHESLMFGNYISTSVLKKLDMFFGITEDDKGHIWLGTLHGIYRYDGTEFTDFKPKKIGEK